MKIKFSSLYSFLFIFIIILIIIYYVNTKSCSSCYCKKKEGMTNSDVSSGSMRGYIVRQIRPLVRKANFSNPTMDYYKNKLEQILR